MSAVRRIASGSSAVRVVAPATRAVVITQGDMHRVAAARIVKTGGKAGVRRIVRDADPSVLSLGELLARIEALRGDLVTAGGLRDALFTDAMRALAEVEAAVALAQADVADALRQVSRAKAEARAAEAEIASAVDAARAEARAAEAGLSQVVSAAQAEARAAEAELTQSVSAAQEEASQALAELQGVAVEIAGLRDQAGANAASVTIEAGARADADHALAGRIDTTVAAYGGDAGDVAEALAAIERGEAARTQARAFAAIRETQVSLADAQKALADHKLVVGVQFGEHRALVSSESIARADADSALGARIDTVQASAAGNAVAISSESVARANADSALGARIDTVQASAANNAASLSSESIARADADTALGARIDTVAASTANNASAVSSESIARTNADTALSARIDTVTATANNNTAAISSESIARSDADTALGARIDTLTTTVNNNTSSLSSESIARSNADSALGARIDTVTTSVNGNTASISTLQTSVNGLGVQWALHGDIDGQTGALIFSGVRAANGTGATFLLRLDANMEINGNLIVSGTIGSGQIANNAITETGFSSGGAANSGTVSVAVPANTTTIIRASYAGGDTIVSGSSPTLKIYVNGSVVASSNVPVGLYTIGAPSTYMLGCTYLSYRYSTAADTTIDVYCAVEPNPGFFGQCTIEVLNMKR